MIALINGKFYGSEIVDGFPNLGLIIDGNRIVDVLHESKIPEEMERVDMHGSYVTPGFIDLLVNGSGGGAFGVTAVFSELKDMGDTMMAEGTTGFLAAAPSNTLPMYLKMQEALKEHQPEIPANCLGMHLEGPFFSMENRGAHREDFVRDCTDAELNALFGKDQHFVSMMSVSPERISDKQVLYMEEKGVRISYAHSAAGYGETLRFVSNPRHSVTHIYNGMTPMHHRMPGHIPAIFHAKPMTGVIVDGVHVAYEMVRMAYEMMPESLYLFTDRFTDCPAMNVEYDAERDCFARTDAEGRKILCGSALSMLKAVRNCVEHVGIPMGKAVRMASYYPAKVLGLDKKVGLLEPGYQANLVSFDEDWNVKKVMFEGKWVKNG
ncbi:MAG: N-acetylglucosamine-6-phosphate deacetylase [Bacteroidaceae bacterium]|nr:N-acetylglucosamine-6-phosphate deacetylase [Bacteroidaceae bacterium]